MPAEGRGPVVVDGANRMRGLRALALLAWHAPRLRRELVAAPGYLRHHLWYRWPLTVGLVSFWSDTASAYAFAHGPAHLALWRRAARTGFTSGGWLAVYRFHHGGELWGDGAPHAKRGFEALVERPQRYREAALPPPEDGR
jgi:heme-degrading monooxygenase HmoA